MTKENPLYAYVTIDGNTWVGKYNPQKSSHSFGCLEEVVVFETPAIKYDRDGKPESFVDLVAYFASMYQSVLLARQDRSMPPIKSEAVIKHENIVTQLYLEPNPENAPDGPLNP